MRKLSIVTIIYKDKVFAKKSLDNLMSIKKQFPDLEILFRDHSSNDGTFEMLKNYEKDVKIYLTENVGLSAGFNDALREVSNEYVLFLGADAYPDYETLIGLCDYFDANPDVTAATTKLVLGDGTLDMDAHRGFPTPWNSFTRLSGLNKLFPKSNFFNGYFLPEADLSKPHEIDLCVSHFMFCRKSFIKKIGGFDEDFSYTVKMLIFVTELKKQAVK
jgi:GT2 family glycosyltransferase